MGSLIKLATWALIESGRAGSARAATSRIAVVALCAGLAGVLVVAALSCAAAALWIYVLPSLGPVGAPLAVASVLSTLMLILALAAWLVLRRNRARPGAAMAPQLLLSQAVRLFNEHKGAVLVAAIVAGMATANSGRKP
jgi:hypothetical protein